MEWEERDTGLMILLGPDGVLFQWNEHHTVSVNWKFLAFFVQRGAIQSTMGDPFKLDALT